MWTDLIQNWASHDWEFWLALGAGLLTTTLVVLLARSLLGRATQRTLRVHPRVLERLPPLGQASSDDYDYTAGSMDPRYRALDRRKSLRRRGTRVKVYICPGDNLADVFEGWVLDRSVGGLCLLVTQPIAERQVLNLRSPNAPDGIPWVQAVVKSCRRRQGRWELGCQFLSSIPWNVLLLFG